MPGPADRRCELAHDRGTTQLAVVETRTDIAGELRDWVAGRDLFVVSSTEVWALHGDATLGALAPEASSWHKLEVPDGEDAKTLAVASELWQEMLASGARRDSLVLTFGGGSVCDLGAFVAATFMRGVEFCHVPTTLLAQVDAAIGGKSAVNLPAAKNVVGVFQHPARVVAATGLLATLPDREIRSGLVETLKVAALLDISLFETLEANLDALLSDRSNVAWPGVVAAAQRAKAGVVTRDPREAGERRVLNFGHTLGHALETTLGYGALTHGEAVAFGIYFALQLAASRGLDRGFRLRLESLLDRLELPAFPRPSIDSVLSALQRDKKAGPKGVVWVLPTSAGSWEAVALPPELVATELASFIAQRRAAC